MDGTGLTGLTQLTFNDVFDGAPAWSPGGKQSAFESRRDVNLEIYVMNADGTGLTNVTRNPADDLSPDWY